MLFVCRNEETNNGSIIFDKIETFVKNRVTIAKIMTSDRDLSLHNNYVSSYITDNYNRMYGMNIHCTNSAWKQIEKILND